MMGFISLYPSYAGFVVFRFVKLVMLKHGTSNRKALSTTAGFSMYRRIFRARQ
jgi:hypothetical protein